LAIGLYNSLYYRTSRDKARRKDRGHKYHCNVTIIDRQKRKAKPKCLYERRDDL